MEPDHLEPEHNISRFELKLGVRWEIYRRGVRVFGMTLAFLVICLLIRQLIARISGFMAYSERLVDVFSRYYRILASDPEAVVDGDQMMEDLYAVEWVMPGTVGWLLCLACALIIVVVRAVYVRYAMIVAREKKATAQDLLAAFNHIGRILLIRLMQAAVTIGGGLFLVIPGLMLFYRYRLALFIMYDRPELSAVGCMKESARLMEGRRRDLLGLDLSFSLWFVMNWIMSSIAASILSIWIMPFTRISWARFYDVTLAGGIVYGNGTGIYFGNDGSATGG